MNCVDIRRIDHERSLLEVIRWRRIMTVERWSQVLESVLPPQAKHRVIKKSNSAKMSTVQCESRRIHVHWACNPAWLRRISVIVKTQGLMSCHTSPRNPLQQVPLLLSWYWVRYGCSGSMKTSAGSKGFSDHVVVSWGCKVAKLISCPSAVVVNRSDPRISHSNTDKTSRFTCATFSHASISYMGDHIGKPH